jgi:hypothetical protein
MQSCMCPQAHAQAHSCNSTSTCTGTLMQLKRSRPTRSLSTLRRATNPRYQLAIAQDRLVAAASIRVDAEHCNQPSFRRAHVPIMLTICVFSADRALSHSGFTHLHCPASVRGPEPRCQRVSPPSSRPTGVPAWRPLMAKRQRRLVCTQSVLTMITRAWMAWKIMHFRSFAWHLWASQDPIAQ